MKAATLICLVEGDYVCAVSNQAAYEYLLDDENRAHADLWLRDIDLRLARLGDGGAFFAAPLHIEAGDLQRIRDDFLRFRDVYAPQIRFISLIRSGREDFRFQPGETLQLDHLQSLVNASTTLEATLRSYSGIIRDASSSLSNHELLKRMLSHLVKEGLMVLANPTTEVYKFTGKLDQLFLAVAVAAEHQPTVTSDDEVEVKKPVQGDLLDDLFDQSEAPAQLDAKA